MIDDKETPQKKNDSAASIEQSVREKKTVITLSLNQNVLDELKQEADKEQTSLSAKVTDILSKHIITYRFSEDIKSVFVSEKTFRLIVDQTDEELFSADFTNNALDFVPTTFYAKNIPFTIENIIKHALRGAGLHGGIYNHLHHYIDQKGSTVIVMRHNFGIKWSRILSKGQCKLIENMLGCNTSYTFLPSSAVIKVHLQKE